MQDQYFYWRTCPGVTDGPKMLNSGGAKMSNCQSLRSKTIALMLNREQSLNCRLFYERLSISEIARRIGCNNDTMRRYPFPQVPPLCKQRSLMPSKLDGFKESFISRL